MTNITPVLAVFCAGVRVCAHTSVSLHLVGMSSEPELFSVHMNGHVLQQSGHRVSSVGLISGSSTTASMTALYTGRWMLSSYTFKHIEGECAPNSDEQSLFLLHRGMTDSVPLQVACTVLWLWRSVTASKEPGER